MLINVIKVAQWAEKNGYSYCNSEYSQTYMILTKDYIINKDIKFIQYIECNFNNNIYKTGIIMEQDQILFTSKEQIDKIYIPLNRVNDDLKNLKKYLKGDK